MPSFFQRLRSERGQSFTEVAISLVFLLVLLSGVVDLGWGYFSMVSLRDSVQEAAAVASICPFPSQAAIVRSRFNEMMQAPPLNISNPNDPAQVEFEMCVMNPNVPSPTFDPAAPCISLTPQRGWSVRISARVQHKIVTPFIGVFLGTQTYPLEATSSNTILIEDVEGCPFN